MHNRTPRKGRKGLVKVGDRGRRVRGSEESRYKKSKILSLIKQMFAAMCVSCLKGLPND